MNLLYFLRLLKMLHKILYLKLIPSLIINHKALAELARALFYTKTINKPNNNVFTSLLLGY